MNTVTERKPPVRVHVTWMIRQDASAVLNIEEESFEFPWLEEDFTRCLRQRNCAGMVAKHEDRVVGFVIYELHKSHLEILDFAVAADCRRQSIGSQMVNKLIDTLLRRYRTRILIEVRETNLPAQLFFRENSFRAVSVLQDYYEETSEDAYLMQYNFKSVDKFSFQQTNRITHLVR